jgi:hypothetical protein
VSNKFGKMIMDNELVKILKRNGGAVVRDMIFNWRD